MNDAEILNRVSKVFEEHGYKDVTLDTAFVGAPITRTGIIMAIEEEFGESPDDPDIPSSGEFLNPLELPDERVVQAKTVRDLVNLVREALNQKGE